MGNILALGLCRSVPMCVLYETYIRIYTKTYESLKVERNVPSQKCHSCFQIHVAFVQPVSSVKRLCVGR